MRTDKFAGFCILGEDILAVDPPNIKDAAVPMTIANGKEV